MRREDLTKHVGSEVSGAIQLNEASDEAVAEILRLVAERGVLLFRSQSMDVEQQISFARRLGPIFLHPLHRSGSRPEALHIHTDAKSDFANGDTWHSDLSWTEAPPALSILRFDVLPSVGGDTSFVSTTEALARLSPPVRIFLETLRARHIYKNLDSPPFPHAIHPVVRTHPLTGRHSLFVNSGYTDRIEGLSGPESSAVLALLFSEVGLGVPFQCRARWEPGTVAIWDNRSTQHFASWDYFPDTRSGWRVTIAGEVPFLDPSASS